jgi:hypothetical protein
VEDVAEEKLSERVDALTAEGWTDQFRADPGGLRSTTSGRVHPLDCLVVDAMHRFEGPSNPDDEAILFALSARDDGTRGTWVIPFGPGASALEAETGRELALRAPRSGHLPRGGAGGPRR